MRFCRWLIVASVLLIGCKTTPPKPPPKLTILGFTLDAGKDLRQDALNDFTRRTGIEVDLIPTPGTSAEQTELMLKLFERRATSPDVVSIDVIWPATLHEHLLDLTPYLTKESQEHLPALLAAGNVNHRVVTLPFYLNMGMLYYRPDLLKKYGYNHPPATWDELAHMSRHIQQIERQHGNKDFWGFLWQGAAYEGLTCNALEWQSSFGGGQIIGDDGSVTANNAHAVQAMKNAASWVGSISPESVLSYTESDSLNGFGSGNAAFLRHWSGAYRGIHKAAGARPIDVALLPAGPAGRAHTVGGFQLAVSRYSTQQAAAADLVLYLTGKEVQMRRALRRGYLPTYPQLYSRPELTSALPQSRVLSDTSATTWVARPGKQAGNKYLSVSKAYYESVHGILAHQTSAEAALNKLAGQLTDLIGIRQQVPGQPNAR